MNLNLKADNSWHLPDDNRVKVKIKRLADEAVVPSKAHITDAGWDLTAISEKYDEYGNLVYGTGWAFEIPTGYMGLLFMRSSISKKPMILANAVGLIDADYRGELVLKFKPSAYYDKHIIETETYKIGERVGQLVIQEVPRVVLEESKELSETARGTGGFGSSNK